MKGIIIYKSKYGATRQYAGWLGAELQLPVVKVDDVTAKHLASYDYIIIGGSVYAGKLQVKDWLKSNAGLLLHKKVFVFIVCGTPADKKEKIGEMVKNNVPEAFRDEVYILPGRMIKENLSGFDRFILSVGARLQKDPADRKNMLKDFDEVRPQHLLPMLKSISLVMNVQSTAL